MLRDPNTGQVMRIGRSKDLLRRMGEHGRDPQTRGLDFEADRLTNDYAQQRGREQILHDMYNPPLDKINPISPNNPNRERYLNAAKIVE